MSCMSASTGCPLLVTEDRYSASEQLGALGVYGLDLDFDIYFGDAGS